jgi:topoisomerase-4 subunit A
LVEEQGQIETLLGSEAKQWDTVAWQIKEVRKAFGKDTALGRRRTTFAGAPDHGDIDLDAALIEREPITVVVSRLGWIRAMKGHLADFSGLSFKSGDELRTAFHAETTDKLLVFSTAGRFYTLGADDLPGGKGQGEPIRLKADLADGEDVVAVFAHSAGRKLLLVSSDGRGFIVNEADLLANTRKGKQVMNVAAPVEAKLCVVAAGDRVAIIGENRKLLIFPASEIPELPRGKGVRLQRYRDGDVSDARAFNAADGLTWMDSSGRSFTRSLDDLRDWIGDRAQAGRLPPQGFPRNNRFGTPPLG